jgi:hypothetical protein
MALVVLAALDCVMVRLPLSGRSLPAILLLVGGLPMANILVVALVPLFHERQARVYRHPRLFGFEFVGWMGLLLFASCSCYYPEAVRRIVDSTLAPIRALGNPAFLTAVCTTFLAPQVAFALLGSWIIGGYAAHLTAVDSEPRRLAHRSTGE